MSKVSANVAEAVAQSPSQEQLTGMLIPDIEVLVTEFCDDTEFLQRVKKRCRIGRTAAARILEERVDGLLALSDERRGNINHTKWGWWGILALLAAGLVQAVGQDLWHWLKPFLTKGFGS